MALKSGETDLPTLLASMQPALDSTTYIFLATTQPLHTLPMSTLQPQMLFQEAEGVSIITTPDLATQNGFHEHTFPCKKISLTVHSSLEAVGLMATIAKKFMDNGISSNVVSGYFHDHIFVPEGREGDAMRVLGELVSEAEVELSRRP